MPQYIIKLEHEAKSYYLVWSTVVDAPTTYGMSLDEFKEYYREEYGASGMAELPARMERVEKKGVSSRLAHHDLDSLIELNRAGKNETTITKEQIIEWYCVKQQECEVEGKPFWNVE